MFSFCWLLSSSCISDILSWCVSLHCLSSYISFSFMLSRLAMLSFFCSMQNTSFFFSSNFGIETVCVDLKGDFRCLTYTLVVVFWLLKFCLALQYPFYFIALLAFLLGSTLLLALVLNVTFGMLVLAESGGWMFESEFLSQLLMKLFKLT